MTEETTPFSQITKRKRESTSSFADVLMKSTNNKVSLKLFINKKGNKVMFAEAGKPFVDFLIHSFSLPLGTIVGLEGNFSFDKLKGSIEDLNDRYFLPNYNKHNLLNPKTDSPDTSNLLLLSYDGNGTFSSSRTKNLYRCSGAFRFGVSMNSCPTNLTEDPKTTCPNCGALMEMKMNIMPSKASVHPDTNMIMSPKGGELGGYVKDMVTYMVMDDLVVKPISTMLVFGLLNAIDAADLEENVVYFGKDEALKLLKVSLTSDKVLTNMFLVKKED